MHRFSQFCFIMHPVCFVFFGLFVLSEAKHTPGRIVGGVGTNIENAPWQISLQFRKQHFCAGSIYSEDIVITAAHCVANLPAKRLEISAGTDTLDKRGIVLRINRVIVHEDYRKPINDIAILHLAGCLVFSPKIAPIALATETPQPKEIATLTGWGYTNALKKIKTKNLQTVNLDIQSPIACKLIYGHWFREHMICAWNLRKSACMGDSGGPLVIDNKLVGIVSFGTTICSGPSVFTDVASLHDWILRTIDGISSSSTTEKHESSTQE